MNYKMIINEGNIPFEISKEELDIKISNHYQCCKVAFLDYLYDEMRNMCGIICAADLGHGYGFSNGFKDFELGFGETYSFSHDYTSIEGPSDWVNDSYDVVVNLIKLED